MQTRQEEVSSISTSLLQLAITNVLANLTIPLASLSNVAFLGHLNNTYHLSGVALVLALFDSLFYSCSFLRASTTGLAAQAIGGDRKHNLYLVLIRNSFLALTLGLTILALKVPLENLGLSFLSTIPEIEAISHVYFGIRVWAVPATLLNFVLVGWLLGQGKSDRVLWIITFINSSKIGLDYTLIIRWNLESVGAGWSVVISQYLMLGIASIVVGYSLFLQNFDIKEMRIFDPAEIVSLVKLNGDIFIRSLAKIAVTLVFTKVGTNLGAQILAENALLLEVIVLTMFIIEGIGYAIETLAGLFEGKEKIEDFFPELRLAFAISFLISAGIGVLVWQLPQQVFGLLTDHQELLQDIGQYTPWLAIVLCCNSIASTQESYFLGRAKGNVVRNTSLLSTFIGFLPVSIVALVLQDSRILWLAMIVLAIVQIIMFAVQFNLDRLQDSEPLL